MELRRTLAAWPSSQYDGELRFNLGLALQLQGGEEKLQEALALYGQVHEKEGVKGFGRSALFQTARLHVQQRQFAAAAGDYGQLLEELGEAPEADVARFELGMVENEAGDWEGAARRLLSGSRATTNGSSWNSRRRRCRLR